MNPESPWPDLARVAVVTFVAAILSAVFDLHEAIFRHTRRWEWLQLDELPIVLGVFAAGLIWWSWRRYLQARRELLARQQAEARLSAVLVENRLLAQAQLGIQEAERKILARELHDEMGQYLNAIKLDAVGLLAGESGPTREAGRHIIHSVDHAHTAVSNMIRRLRPAGLDELGLAAALENCVDHWRQRLPGTRFSLSFRGELEDLGESLNLTLFRLIQESLTNCYKHAAAPWVEVCLHRSGQGTATEQIEVSVSDDGCGATAGAMQGGHGLRGMRERVALLGGELSIETAAGAGFCVRAVLPGPAPAGGLP